MLSSSSNDDTSEFYELASVILSRDSCIHKQMGMGRKVLEMKVSNRLLTFEECCRFVREARNAELLVYTMLALGMRIAEDETHSKVH